MFHVKQNSLDSDNLQDLSCILHMLQLSYPYPFPSLGRGLRGGVVGGVVKWFMFHVKHFLRCFLKNSQLELWLWLVRLGR